MTPFLLLPGLVAPAGAAPADHVLQAVELMSDGDFDAAHDSLNTARSELLASSQVINGTTLAEVYYYRGLLFYYSGAKEEIAQWEWWRALEKEPELAWDVGLVSDPSAQLLFEELRLMVKALPSVHVSLPDEGRVDVVYIDGRAMRPSSQVVEGEHLVQVRCMDGGLGTFLHDFGVPPQYGFVCNELADEPGWLRRRLAKLQDKLARDKNRDRDRLPKKTSEDLVAIAADDKDANRRGDALRILDDRAAAETVGTARTMAVDDPDARNRELAVAVLERRGSEADAEALGRVLAEDSDPRLRRKAAIVLRKTQACAQRETQLARLQEERDTRVLIELGYGLAVCGMAEDRPSLHELMLGHIDPAVRAGLANGLAAAGPVEADREPLLRLLDDPIDEPAIAGAWALAGLDDAGVRDELAQRSESAGGKRGREFARAAGKEDKARSLPGPLGGR